MKEIFEWLKSANNKYYVEFTYGKLLNKFIITMYDETQFYKTRRIVDDLGEDVKRILTEMSIELDEFIWGDF